MAPANKGFRADQATIRETDLRLIEQFEFIPLGGMRQFRLQRQARFKFLPDGGRVVLIIPAFQGLYGPIDHLLGHYRRYTKKSVRALASATGFEPVELHYLNLVGYFGWWANAKVFKRTEQSETQIATFDKLIVPWLRPLESAVRPPVGQSLFTVLEKRVAH